MDHPASPESGGRHPRSFLAFLVLTSMVCGAMVMVIEVLGSRIMSPVFGVSLFVWTSLISVTLVSLAAGYAVGGAVADRRPTPDTMYLLIMMAGVATLAIPFARGPVLAVCLPLGLRAGALASAALLFSAPLLLLGCVSPYLVRLTFREMGRLGRTVGLFQAVSTVGSFAGTVLTGFFLIGHFGVGRTFQVVGTILVVLALAYAVLFRRSVGPLRGSRSRP